MANKNKSKKCDLCGDGGVGVNVAQVSVNPSVVICEVCASKIHNHFVNKRVGSPEETAPVVESVNELLPYEIAGKLSEYVIGQDIAKEKLAVAVYNHYLRTQDGDGEMDKSNVLTFGPTGTGKTLLAKTLAKILDVPFVVADATTVTEAGYVGEDVENIVLKLLREADGDVSKAERGIIYIDEIDKIGSKNGNTSITRDVSGEGVQQALLKIIEGTDCNVPDGGGRKHPTQGYIKVDTSKILFICGGAFVGLDKIIKKRIKSESKQGEQKIGFGSACSSGDDVDPFEGIDNIYEHAEPSDMYKFGLIPEFIGRLPVFCPLKDLSRDELLRIIAEPTNNILSQFEKIFEKSDIEMKVSETAMGAIVDEAISKKTGARGLRSIFERVFHDIIFNIHEYKGAESITITKNTVTKGTKPRIKPAKKVS